MAFYFQSAIIFEKEDERCQIIFPDFLMVCITFSFPSKTLLFGKVIEG